MDARPPSAHKHPFVRVAPFVAVALLFALGSGFWIVGSTKTHDAQRVAALEVLDPAAALQQPRELLAVRGVASSPEPLHEPEIPDALLYVKHTRTERRREWGTSRSARQYRTETRTIREQWAPAFDLGPIRVRPQAAKVIQAPLLRETGDDAWYGIRTGETLTVIGALRNGEIADGEPFLISTLPLEAVRLSLQTQGKVFRLVGAAVAGFGVLLLAGLLIYRRFVRTW